MMSLLKIIVSYFVESMIDVIWGKIQRVRSLKYLGNVLTEHKKKLKP